VKDGIGEDRQMKATGSHRRARPKDGQENEQDRHARDLQAPAASLRMKNVGVAWRGVEDKHHGPRPACSKAELAAVIVPVFRCHQINITQISRSSLRSKLGDALSPLLFNFALQYVITNVQENQVGLKLNGTHQLLGYADDVNLLADNIDTINKNTQTLIDASKEVGLEGNVEKTKYMLVSRDQNVGQITNNLSKSKDPT
jgi:hypothetical protein